MKSLTDMGIEKPTPIQEQALPILLGEPTDFLGLAATGTGKTLAFSLPLLSRIDPSVRAVQGLILCPTRELAVQVAGQIDLLGKHLGVRALTIYGGAPYGDQIRGLKNGAQVVVGTPGRIVDHLEKGTLRLAELQNLILDEADEMISMGFKEDLEKILSSSPQESSNIWLFSATMSREVRKIADQHLRNPEQVQVNRTEIVPEAIDQIYYRAHESDKPEIICKLIDAADDFYGIIFCQTKALVSDLTQYLSSRGYGVDCLHGDMDQNARERTMKSFRDRAVKILVCTDVASRGLDVKDITHVINYSLPRELDNYVHRIGRTARSGKTGYAMSLVTPSHRGLIGRIEHLTKSKMREGKLPTRREIGAKKVALFLSRFTAQGDFEKAIELMRETGWSATIAEMSTQEIVARILTMRFPEVFSDREDVETAQVLRSEVRVRDERSAGGREDRRYGRPSDREKGGRPERRSERGGERKLEEAKSPRQIYSKSESRHPESETEAASVIANSSQLTGVLIDSVIAEEQKKRKEYKAQKTGASQTERKEFRKDFKEQKSRWPGQRRSEGQPERRAEKRSDWRPERQMDKPYGKPGGKPARKFDDKPHRFPSRKKSGYQFSARPSKRPN